MTAIENRAAAAFLTFNAHMPSGYLKDAITEARNGDTREIEFFLQMDENSSDDSQPFEFEDVDPEAIRVAIVSACRGKTIARIEKAADPSFEATYEKYLAA
ncbi:hypothetical protein NKY66_11070 [Sinorhizobium meliloti]|uniref:hypothetical protein n=1 Tax=Rhizobium meliloti TaxID=382 RepID=UPI003D655304